MTFLEITPSRIWKPFPLQRMILAKNSIEAREFSQIYGYGTGVDVIVGVGANGFVGINPVGVASGGLVGVTIPSDDWGVGPPPHNAIKETSSTKKSVLKEESVVPSKDIRKV